jgi:hypothetical protein
VIQQPWIEFFSLLGKIQRGESILLALAFRNVPFHLVLPSKVEGYRAIDLLEAQRRIM